MLTCSICFGLPTIPHERLSNVSTNPPSSHPPRSGAESPCVRGCKVQRTGRQAYDGDNRRRGILPSGGLSSKTQPPPTSIPLEGSSVPIPQREIVHGCPVYRPDKRIPRGISVSRPLERGLSTTWATARNGARSAYHREPPPRVTFHPPRRSEQCVLDGEIVLRGTTLPSLSRQ